MADKDAKEQAKKEEKQHKELVERLKNAIKKLEDEKEKK